MVIGVPASMAEFERELIKERTALKRAVSRDNGTKFGRRTKVADPGHVATARRMKADGHTARDVACRGCRSSRAPTPAGHRCRKQPPVRAEFGAALEASQSNANILASLASAAIVEAADR